MFPSQELSMIKRWRKETWIVDHKPTYILDIDSDILSYFLYQTSSILTSHVHNRHLWWGSFEVLRKRHLSEADGPRWTFPSSPSTHMCRLPFAPGVEDLHRRCLGIGVLTEEISRTLQPKGFPRVFASCNLGIEENPWKIDTIQGKASETSPSLSQKWWVCALDNYS